MSINITVHGSPVKCSQNKKFLLDEERAKNDLIQERRKLRLEQVRQKSKELASRVRKDVELEKKKQLQKIEDTRERELQKWREKTICQKQDEYQSSILHVGEAHRAAEAECQSGKFSRPCTVRCITAPPSNFDKWGDVRPTEPTPKKRKIPAKNMTYKHFCQERAKKKPKKYPDKENLSNFANICNKNKKSAAHIYPSVQVQQADGSTTEDSINLHLKLSPLRKNVRCEKSTLNSTSSSDNKSRSPCKRVSSRLLCSKKPKSKLMRTPSVILEIDSECDSSELDMEDTHDITNMKFSRVSSKANDSIVEKEEKKDSYHASDYKPTDSSTDQACSRKTRFTQISDLIKQHDDTKGGDSIKNTDLIESICRESERKSSPPRGSPKKYQDGENKVNKTKSPDRSKRSSNLKSTSKVSSKADSLQPPNRVQFYDYCNKFEKRYDHPNVVRTEQQKEQLNAMQQAELELHARNLQLEELEKLRQKCDMRSQKALEREQIRRDYESLTAKLDALTKGKTKSQGTCDDAHLFSEARLKQVASERQNKMNTAVENVLKRPVLITCPEIENVPKVISSGSFKKPSATDINLASYQKSAKDDFNNLNSSDSCASILLNYVDSQSKLISEDIHNCDNSDKVKKLKELLDKINCLRKKLLEELEKTKEKDKAPDIKDVVQDISVLRRERENILLGKEREKKLEQREKRLQKKEAILEKKLKEFYEMSKSNGQASSSTESETIVLSPTKLKASKPVEIIIKVKDDQSQKKIAFKSPRKRASLINLEPKKKFKTPQKKRPKAVEKEVQTTPQTEEVSSSTSYRSLPKDINTILNSYFEKTATSKQKVCMKKSEKVSSELQEPSKSIARHLIYADSSKKCTNPVLAHYIQRLLGMSRHSIEMLGVSSTEGETPSSSIINISANKSITEIDTGQKERLDRIEKFIKDNYSFLSEVEESLKTDKSCSTDSSLKAIEEIWKRTLKHKEKDKKKKTVCKTIKPILKKDHQIAESEKSVHEINTPKTKKSEDPDKIELVNKYTELTDNCTQRIAELTEMINKVRQEKQKILEITLSSGSASARSTTEYADFAERRANKSEDSDHSSKICDERVLIEDNEKGRLEKNKLTGVSRDSGISMSRPLTALDYRESPALHICDKFSPSPQEPFEPLLKDIPKPGKTSQVSTFPFQLSSQKPTEVFGDKHKKAKPPVSITRYSPQLNEDVHHELSTILEVDTSATPRSYAPKVDKPAALPQLEVDQTVEKISYTKFPTFEEYARSKQLDLTQFDPDVSSKLQIELQELLRISNKATDLQYKEFPCEAKSIHDGDDDVQESIDNLIESLKLLNLSVKRFPTHQEYLDKLGASDIINSKSIESSETEKKCSNEFHSAASVESLPDVVEELIRRNIIKHSFRNENREGADPQVSQDVKSSTESQRPGSSEVINTVQSPRKSIEHDHSSTDRKSKSKSPEKRNIASSDRTRKTAMREEDLLSGVEVLQFSSNQSNSDGIEKDLDRMGLKWASLMLRKSQKSQETGTSSTSSSFVHVSRKKSPRKHDQSKKCDDKEEHSSNVSLKDSAEGRPLNLREFLAKELQKRTQTSSCSTLTDDSVASQILRSLLGSGNSTPTFQTSSNEVPNSEQPNRILTSTPVLTRSASPSKPSTSTGSQKLFSAESLSSVRYSNSGSDSKSNPDCNPNSKEDDNLIAPSVRLERDQDIDYFEY